MALTQAGGMGHARPAAGVAAAATFGHSRKARCYVCTDVYYTAIIIVQSRDCGVLFLAPLFSIL